MYEGQGRGSGLQSVKRGVGWEHMCLTVGSSNIMRQTSVARTQARLTTERREEQAEMNKLRVLLRLCRRRETHSMCWREGSQR